jgi:hypothetical protein
MVKLLEASYLVSKRIAMAVEARTVVQNLTKPCILDAVCAVLNEASAKKTESVPLYNNKVCRHIGDMAGLCSRSKSYHS